MSAPSYAADISTHVLDLSRGVGGRSVPVTLSKRIAGGGWQEISTRLTDSNGRVQSFGTSDAFDVNVYRLKFDMSAYPDASAAPFFPEIILTFNVTNAAGHYHVPVVVSPYGYSSYRGN